MHCPGSGQCMRHVIRSQPVSRVLSWTVIHLGCASPHTSCDLPGNGAGRTNVPLFGLAPGGVYPATPVTRRAVRSYRTISPLPAVLKKQQRAVYFLWHWPLACAPQALPGTLPCGARTFLPAQGEATVWPTPGCHYEGNSGLTTPRRAPVSGCMHTGVRRVCSLHPGPALRHTGQMFVKQEEYPEGHE